MNIRYYKIVDNELQQAPTNLTIDGVEVMYPTEEQYLSQGWKPLLVAERPIANEYYRIFPFYSETETNIIQEWENRIVESIEKLKTMKLRDLKVYDKSSEVNSFSINGMNMWLAKNDRAALMYSIESEEAMGLTMTSIYTSTIPSIMLEIPTTTAKLFLQALEVYAKQAYSVTQEHQNTIVGLTASEDVVDYQFNTGYPDKVAFVL